MRSLAARLGISRNTIAKAVSADGLPSYVRAPQDSGIKAVEPAIRALSRDNPRMPATVLAERVGWSASPAWFRENMARIRPEYAPADPADRIGYEPGDQVQCNLWFPEVRIPVGSGKSRVLPVVVMVCCHSRFSMTRMIPSRMTGELFAGTWKLIRSLGAVPRWLIWDNEAGIGRLNSHAAGVAAFAGVLATRIVQAKPYDPESKGVVERANRFLDTSFLPARAFVSPEDFNAQLGRWLPIANDRLVRRTGARPAELLGRDNAAMLGLPPVPPVTGFATRVGLPRDYYVRMGSNDYSVHLQAIGRFVDVTADLETVIITLDSRCIRSRARSWGVGLTITDPDHVEAARTMRKAF
ncbi:IS21 family transposase [Arthrobacter sp. KNU-44]|uniref:IS21 family transposase n=1 Tax=Arthrobacter sp. KNU-44 TaxID=3450744 RepID=UPI003F434D2C